MKPNLVSPAERLERARLVLQQEARAVLAAADHLDESFSRAIDLVLGCEGRVVVTGVGKSGLICKKIAATLASTGTPAFFLHAGDALHGDLGMIVRGDLVLAVSYSGQSDEILGLVGLVKRLGAPLIVITGNPGSDLAGHADIVLRLGPLEEACNLGLAPTSSTTASLALGDALALVLQEIRGFRELDFAKLHPAGNLGRRLQKVEDLMHGGQDLPVLPLATLMQEAIFYISTKGLGVTAVVDGEGRLRGILTDGDLRRAMEKGPEMLVRPIHEFMTVRPKMIHRSALVARALRKMERYTITALVVTDGQDHPVGILKLQDIVKSGLV